MSETLSAGERARMREWHAPDLEPGGVQPWCICGFRWPCPIERSLATIEALQAELQEQRRVVKAAEVIIANADGHPAMCCGKCSSAIAKAEAEVTRLRERLWHHHQGTIRLAGD